MQATRTSLTAAAFSLLFLAVSPLYAVDIEFVTVGNAGNAADATGFGAVGYDYQIGKYEVTAGQYAEFLNAVAATSDPYGLYNSAMAGTQYGSKITKSDGVYTALSPNQPVNYVSWGDACRFCNWLQHGQPVGAEGEAATETGAYALGGKTSSAELMTVIRGVNAKYVLPTYDEWYKAAYYDPNKNGAGAAGYWTYPTKSDVYPSSTLSSTGTNNANYAGYTLNPPNTTEVGYFAGSPSPYGTFDQGGNVREWNETAVGSSERGIHGGSFSEGADTLAALDIILYDNTPPAWEVYEKGFRIAEVPEPSGFLLIAVLGVALYFGKMRNLGI
jgi:formylglycine-generating enzyme required for sulfatase activity